MNSEKIWKTNFRMLWMSQFISIAGLTVLVPLLPIYMASLQDLSVVEIQFWSGIAIAAPAITTMISSPLWGKLGDKISQKWMVLRALFGLGMCLLLMGLCQTPLQFVIVRLLQGVFGGVVDASSAFASSEAPPEKRGAVLGKLQSSVSAGSLIGPLIGGVLATLLGFQVLLIGIAIFTFVICVCGVFLLKETAHIAITSSQKVHSSVRRSIQCLLSSKVTSRFIVVGILANFAMYGMLTALAPLTSEVNQTAVDQRAVVGFLQSAFWTASMMSAPLWGYFNDRSYVKSVYITASVLCGLSVVLQGISPNVWILGIARILQGLTYSALIQSVMFVVVNASDQRLKGTFVGSTNSLLVLGQVLGSLGGAAITSYTQPSMTFIVMGCVFIMSSLVLCSSHIKNQKVDLTLMKLWEAKEKRAKA